MSQDWYYTKDKQTKVGPLSAARLKELARSGQLTPTDLVRRDGMPKWLPAGKVQGLFEPGKSAEVPSSPHPVSTLGNRQEVATADRQVGQQAKPKGKVIDTWTGLSRRAKVGVVAGTVLLAMVMFVFVVGMAASRPAPGQRSHAPDASAEGKADASGTNLSADFSQIDYTVPKVDYSKGPAGQEVVQRDGDPEEGKAVTEMGFTDSAGTFVRHGVRVLWYSRNGKKFAQEEWYDGKRHGTLVSWDTQDRKRLERSYKAGEKHGKETIWGEEGGTRRGGGILFVKSETMFANGKRHGVYREFHPNGQKSLEAPYVDGQAAGRCVGWHPGSQKEMEYVCTSGHRHGTYMEWHENGQKRKEGEYKDGKEQGKWATWSRDGEIASEYTFTDGKQTGIHTVYGPNKSLHQVNTFVDGMKVKQVTFFPPDTLGPGGRPLGPNHKMHEYTWVIRPGNPQPVPGIWVDYNVDGSVRNRTKGASG